MTEKTISIQYFSTYSELVTFMENLNSLVQTRELEEGNKILVYHDSTKDSFTFGGNSSCDICCPYLFTEDVKLNVRNNGYLLAVMNDNGLQIPNNYYEMVSESINMNVLRKTDPSGRLSIPRTELVLNASPVGLFLTIEGDGNQLNNDYFYRLSVELLRAAFLVQQTGMEMSL